MIILALTDIHGDTSSIDTVFDQAGDVDLVLLLGDITHFGNEQDAKRVIDPIVAKAPRIFGISGNCDYPEVADYLKTKGSNIHRRHEVLDGIGFLGIGSSLPCPGKTPNEMTEAEFEHALADAVAGFPSGIPMILIIHQPPWGTRNDRVGTGQHVGSRSVRHFIEQHQPLICFTGHIHEGIGVDTIGETTVVNPGPLRHGGYAVAEITGGQIEALEIRNIREEER